MNYWKVRGGHPLKTFKVDEKPVTIFLLYTLSTQGDAHL
jgi:hypothetical protein